MTLLDDLLGYDPEFDLEDDDPPADHWAIAKALEQADQLLAKLDLATVEPLLGQLRDAAGGSRYCGYLALLTQGRISPLVGGRAYHAMGRALYHGPRAADQTLPYFDLARLCYAACVEPPEHDQASLKAGYAGVLYASEQESERAGAAVTEALRLAHEALDFFERTGNRYDQARVWSILSDIYQYAEHDQALVAAARALELAEHEPRLQWRRGQLLRDLGQAYYLMHDDIQQARLLLDQAEVLLADHDENQRAALLSTKALIALDIGEFDLAQRAMLQARDLYQRNNNSQDLALNDFDLARLALALGDQAKAEALLLQARKGFQTHGNQKEEAEALVLLAQLRPIDEALGYFRKAEQIFSQRNNQHALALVQFEHARTIMRQRRNIRRYKAERAAALSILVELAERFTALGRPRYALLVRVEALLGESAQGPRPLYQLTQSFGDSDDPLTMLRLWQAIGERHEALGEYEQARTAYREAIGALEKARAQIRLNAHVARFFEHKRRPYERAFALALAQPDLAAAWIAAEKPRALALLDSVVNPRTSYTDSMPDSPRWAEVQTLRAQLNIAYAARMPETRSNAFRSHSNHTGSVSATIRDLEDRLGALLDELSIAGDRRASWELGQVCAPLDLAKVLGPQTALVEYMLVSRADMPNTRDLMALVLTQEGLRLPGEQGLIADEGRLELLGGRFQAAQLEDDEADLLPLLGDIYADLIAPLADLIAPYEHVVFVLPDNEPWMARLPLHAAHNGQRYLIEQHVVSYAPSASILWQCLQRPAPPISSVLTAGYGPDLRHTKAELEVVQAQLGGGPPLLDPHTAVGLLDQIATADLVHLSCHAAPGSGADARFAYLAIAADQYIFAHDCFARQIRADLVVLSACETGREDQVGLGLVGGFLAAGARSLLATLWKANDSACITLIDHFYRALTSPNRPGRAAALATAQRAMIASPDQHHPARWAAFVLIGAFDPINLPDNQL